MRNAVFPVCLEDPVRDKQAPGGVSVSSCGLAGGCVSRLLRYALRPLIDLAHGQALSARAHVQARSISGWTTIRKPYRGSAENYMLPRARHPQDTRSKVTALRYQNYASLGPLGGERKGAWRASLAASNLARLGCPRCILPFAPPNIKKAKSDEEDEVSDQSRQRETHSFPTS
ncbi:hypothetical protein H112_07703 [Trichophyton rubrum D6]|uniref:Uncharacterized protein n=1 Tax=Trichophyton soudanense CBS 452.61 TaxID=1215331 RepID=A0A022XGL0_TRISD|nr:hypothetical protein H104_07664 [Trichophyton rubrum CBS 289.86]EZF69865.1 hypothetical protein H105_07719 [Trichophyton soudanense CBS 452.61]EZF80490.1 hypothetical protein H110_07712 [Trichophyton rubrum MR1448]KDB29665.1 hypothetical protein H112_07703 [Trichophyton rubrum D6]